MDRPPPRTVVSGPKARRTSDSQNGEFRDLPPRKRAIIELLTIPIASLASVAAAQEMMNPGAVSPYAMDVATIGDNMMPLADAVSDLGDAYPVIGAALDKVTAISPIAALAGVVGTMGLQIAENHGKLPEPLRAVPGLRRREDFAVDLKAQAAHMQDMAATNGTI